MKLKPLQYGLFLLKNRDYSVGQMERKMREKEYSPEDIAETTLRLKELKFLDDERFASHYIKNTLSIKPAGKYILEQKLRQKLVPDDIIDKALNTISENDEKEGAALLLKKWIKVRNLDYNSMENKEKYKLKQKMIAYLAGRGFSYDLIKEAIDRTIDSD